MSLEVPVSKSASWHVVAQVQHLKVLVAWMTRRLAGV